MELTEVLELLQTLCAAHPDIKGFYTGTTSQHDDNNIQYPAVRVVFPTTITPNMESGVSTLKINLSIRVNEASIPMGTQIINVNLNYLTENNTINEINNDIALENALRDKATRLAIHLIKWIEMSEDNYSYFKLLKSYISGVERSEADFVTGVNVALEIAIGNPYICEAETLFNELF